MEYKQNYVLLKQNNEVDRVVSENYILNWVGRLDDVGTFDDIKYMKLYEGPRENLKTTGNNEFILCEFSVEENCVNATYTLSLKEGKALEIAETEEWPFIREKRNQLLTESDWIVIKYTEQGLPLPSLWVSYRQQLRDITTQSSPFNIVWPTKPE